MKYRIMALLAVAAAALALAAPASAAPAHHHQAQCAAATRHGTRFAVFTAEYRHRIWDTSMTSGPVLTHPIRGLDTRKGLRMLLRRWVRARADGSAFRVAVVAANHLYPPSVQARVCVGMLRHRGQREVWGVFAGHELIWRIAIGVGRAGKAAR